MGRKLYINWNELHDLARKTETNVTEMEKIRGNMMNIISSLSTCWTGGDSMNFITNSSNYLSVMKNDVNYLMDWTNAFYKSSSLYKNSVDECTSYVRKNRISFEKESEKLGERL